MARNATLLLWPLLMYAVFFCSLAEAQDLGASYGKIKEVVVYGGDWYRHWHKGGNQSEISLLDLKEGQARAVYDNGTFPLDICISPSNTHIAFIEYLPLSVGKHNLIVLTMTGDIVATLPNVYKFAWRPNGLQISYIAGRPEEGYPGFRDPETCVFDTSTRSTTKVYSGGYDLQWAEFDDNLYIYQSSNRIVRYDPRSQTLSETPYRGIYFSPDGKFFYCAPYEGGTLSVFLTATNEDVTGRWNFLAFGAESLYPRGWLGMHTLVIPSGTPEQFDYLVNLDDSSVRKAPGKVVSFIDGDQSILLLSPRGFTVEDLSKFEILEPAHAGYAIPPAAPAGLPFSYIPLGDVALEADPWRIKFSESGKHFSIEYGSLSDHFVAVYTDPVGHKLRAVRLPKASGTWRANDALYVRIPDTHNMTVVLPPHPDVTEALAQSPQDPAADDTMRRLSVAAWQYCENSSFDLSSASGDLVCDSLQALSDITKEYFGDPLLREPRNDTERVLTAAVENMSAANQIYFTQEDGKPGYEGDVRIATQRLFMIEGASKVEVTGPDSRGFIQSFSWDKSTRRVCVWMPLDTLVYDARTGQRWTLPSRERSLDREFNLIHGENYLVAHVKPRSTYVDQWLELWTLDGRPLGAIPTRLNGLDDRVVIGKIAISQHLLVVPINGRALRIFQSVHSF